MGRFELASDFVINDTLKPHVKDDFRVVPRPGRPIRSESASAEVYPKILTTGSGNAVHAPFLFEKLIALTGLERPNVVYIGTPFFDREDKYESGTASFRNIGCKIKRLMVAKECTTPSEEELRRIIVDWADLIMVSGGNSLFAMLRWQSIGLDLLIRQAAVKGKVLCGGSAGCGCYFASMQTDSLKPEACKLAEKVLSELSAEERLNWSFARITCLGFINAFCIPHIDTVGTNNIARVDIAKKMLLEANMEAAGSGDPTPVYGLGVDEKACIIYEDGKLSIYSAGPRANGMGAATCHVLFVNSHNEVECIPITPNTGEATPLDELIERAMRSVVALQSPLDLIVSNSVASACHRRGHSGAINWMGNMEEAERSVEQQQLPSSKQGHERTLSYVLSNFSPIPEKNRLSKEAMAVPPLPPPPPPTLVRSPSFDSFLEGLPVRAELAQQTPTMHMRAMTIGNAFDRLQQLSPLVGYHKDANGTTQDPEKAKLIRMRRVDGDANQMHAQFNLTLAETEMMMNELNTGALIPCK